MKNVQNISTYFKILTALDYLKEFTTETDHKVDKSKVYDAALLLNTALHDLSESMDLHEHRVLAGVLGMETQNKTQEAL